MSADPMTLVEEHLAIRVPRATGLVIRSFRDVLEDLERREKRGWLIEGLWPEDAYGVTGGAIKTGKTWAVTDLAVSVTTGTAWLGRFHCPPGDVVCFLGEGGEANFVRRVDAVARHRDVLVADLAEHLRVCARAPHLRDKEDVDAITAELQQQPARLVIIDPAYLALAGAKGSDLFAMGEVLGEIQRVCEGFGSALILTMHWNKGGQGTGADRFTGVGPGEWGRVLASAAVEQQTTDADGASIVTLLWEFTGSEIPETKFRMSRRVCAEDPLDLTSPLHYEVEVTEEGTDLMASAGATGGKKSQTRILVALEGATADSPRTVKEIGDRLARDGHGKALAKRTIQDGLLALAKEQLVDCDSDGVGTPGRWWPS